MKLIRKSFLLFVAWMTASAAVAETARIRSGEHPGFSRLVIELSEPAQWRLGRVDGGYGLDIQRDGLEFDTSEVYRLIKRDRLADIRQKDGRLFLDVACECYVKAVDFNTSWLVIDIMDGTPPSDDAFETLLDASDPSVEVAEEPKVDAPEPKVQRVLPRGQNRPSIEPLDITALQNKWLDDLAADGDEAEEISEYENAFDPAERIIVQQEERLLKELARAASQGLLEADLPTLERLETLPKPSTEAEPVSEATNAPEAVDHVRIEAETSIDRDTRISRSEHDVTHAGLQCLSNSLVAVEEWGGEGDVVAELAERRMGLVGEFDQPDPQVVLDLARYYLYLGFGAEAKATVNAFGVKLPETEIVLLLANIMDGKTGNLPGILAAQGTCNGRVALWSVLAENGPNAGDDLNIAAIQAAFSALPLHIRRHIGPGLAGKFLELGDQATAINIRNAITRAPGQHGAELGLLDARIGMSEDSPAAASDLQELLTEDPAIAAEAYAEFLQAQLEAGHAPADAPETAAALAFELAGTPLGDELAELAIRSLLSFGSFDKARREVLRLEAEHGHFSAPLWAMFAQELVAKAQDEVFLQQIFATETQLLQAELSASVLAETAGRLNGLGFYEKALIYASAEAEDEATKIARANALLMTGSASEVSDVLAGVDGADVDRLRAQALRTMGGLQKAAEHFNSVRDNSDAEHIAWRAGAWSLLRESSDPTIQKIAEDRLGNSSEENDNQSLNANGSESPADYARNALDKVTASRTLLSDLVSR